MMTREHGKNGEKEIWWTIGGRITNKLYVHVETQQEYNWLMGGCVYLGFKWATGECPTELNVWNKFGDRTVIIVKKNMQYTTIERCLHYPPHRSIMCADKAFEEMHVITPRSESSIYNKLCREYPIPDNNDITVRWHTSPSPENTDIIKMKNKTTKTII